MLDGDPSPTRPPFEHTGGGCLVESLTDGLDRGPQFIRQLLRIHAVADAEAAVEHAFANVTIHPIRLIQEPEAGLRRHGRSRPFRIADNDKFAAFTARNAQFNELRQATCSRWFG